MTAFADGRRALEDVLEHTVDVVLPPVDGSGVVVAVSRTGDPPRVRAAWVTEDGSIVARIGCPPGVPSAVRPLIAAVADVSADGVSDHVLLGRAAPGVNYVRALFSERELFEIPVGHGQVIAGRIPRDRMLLAVDALTQEGEAIGRLTHAGVTEIALVAGRLEGRLGAMHGMAAGFGAGDTVPGLAEAELEAGYTALLPTGLPDGFVTGTVRVEPEAAYPYAPPSIAIAWTNPLGHPGADSRILLRQGPAPLAVPERTDGRGRAVDIHGHIGVLRNHGVVFLVWEAGDTAFGLQVRGLDAPEDVALRVARSVPARPTGLA